MRDLGSVQSPNEAFLLNVGLESLHLRVQRHCENAKKVAEYLENHPKIEWVKCSMLPSDSQYALAQKYMPNGTCGVVSFGVKGGRNAATTFMDSLELAAVVTHVADARTCCLHPASTTHRQLTDEQLAECGVTPDLVRFSCGIEAAEDIIADIEQDLTKGDFTMLEYRYDTQLLIEGTDLDEDAINDYFVEHFKGDCLIAVGDEDLIKIHYHTNEPWKVLEYRRSLGEIYDIVIEDMDRQERGLKG